jgi:L-seryl-tRNA(Ser) seleniumtransferase
VLRLYRRPEFLAERLTTLRMLTRTPADIREQAVRLQPAVKAAVGDAYAVADAPMSSQIGSGALPVEQLASYGLAVRVVKGRRGSLDRLDRALRALPRPVIARVADKTLWLDLRCLEASDEADFVAQSRELRP